MPEICFLIVLIAVGNGKELKGMCWRKCVWCSWSHGPVDDLHLAVALQSKERMEDSETVPPHNISKSEPILQQAELYSCRRKVEPLEQELKKAGEQPFGFSSISGSSFLVCHYTGLPKAESFQTLIGFCLWCHIKYYKEWNVQSNSEEDQLLLTLMKLKCDFPLVDLGVRFYKFDTTVVNFIRTWFEVLHNAL